MYSVQIMARSLLNYSGAADNLFFPPYPSNNATLESQLVVR